MSNGQATFLIVANGPGEISGWVLPIASEARRRGSSILNLVLVLPPSQFASGREADLAASSGLFDAIVPTPLALKVAVGLATLPVQRPAVLLHLGGDLLFSGRLAARLRIPAFAYAEEILIARRHTAFEHIFVPNDYIARSLATRGIPRDRLGVVGDPRVDAVKTRRDPAIHTHGNGSAHVVMLPGSRERFFHVLFPYWVETGRQLRSLVPNSAITIAVPPFLPEEQLRPTIQAWEQATAAADIRVVRRQAADAIADADLVLTVPGTTTMEAAVVPVAALVIFPTQFAGRAPAEGLVEWVLRIPLLGPVLKRAIASTYVARWGPLALPNRLAGRYIMPELMGNLKPERVASEAAALLRDDRRRAEIERELALVAGPPGASARIADYVLEQLGIKQSVVVS